MKIFIVGLGSAGRRHLKNLLAIGIPEEDIILIRSGKSTLPDGELSKFHTEYNLEKALKMYRPNIVIISNPTSLHMDSAISSGRCGAHIFIEKPISNSFDKLDELLRIIEREKKLVYVGFQYRFHPGLKFVKDLMHSREIGEIIHVEVHWGEFLPSWHPWEDYRKSYAARKELGGGVTLTLCHPFDYLRWLVGDVQSVYADIRNTGKLDIDVDDLANITLKFTSGATGTVHLNYLQKPKSHWIEIVGENETVRWEDDSGRVQVYKNGTWHNYSFNYERNAIFLDEMKHFLACVEGKEKPKVSIEDGIEALRIALAAKKSSVEKRLIELEEVR